MKLVCLVVVLSVTQSAFGQDARSHTIQIGCDGDYPPYEFVGNDGKASGFDVDIVRAAAQTIHLDSRLEAGEWRSVRKQLEDGQIDLVTGMLYSPERAKKVEFSNPILLVEYSAFVRKGSSVIRSPEDLSSKSVLVEDGSQMHDRLRHLKVNKIVPVSSEPEALRELAAGRADIALVPLLEGQTLILDEGIENVEPSGPPLFEINLCMAATKGNKELISKMNVGLATIQSNGTYDAIYDHWFGRLTPASWLRERITLLAYWSCCLAVAILSIAALWVGTLRRQVRLRTQELALELQGRAKIETDLRDSEAKFRNIIDQATDGIYQLDADLVVTAVNPALKEMLGYDQSEIIGQHISEWMAPEDLAIRPLSKSQVDAGEQILVNREFVRKNGSRFFVEISAKKLPCGGYQGIVRDVSARKSDEEQLRKLNEDLERRVAERTSELEHAFRELESFSYSVSHDLRAPLRAMSGYAAILRQEFEETLPESGQHYLLRISENAKRMGGLIDDLLGYARVGRQTMSMRRFSMDELVRSVWAEYSSECESRSIAIDIHALPHIEGDEVLIRQLLNNLLGNALKFTRNVEHVSIEVGYDWRQSAFFVQDNGAGFDPQYSNKLFQVFERLHAEDFEGTGVGLAIVKRVVERHHGQVWATGSLGEGATFWFTLPQDAVTLQAAS
jgi:PAS domain S-box-containing protein